MHAPAAIVDAPSAATRAVAGCDSVRVRRRMARPRCWWCACLLSYLRTALQEKRIRRAARRRSFMLFDPLAPCPLLTADLPGVGGRIKTTPEDFEVEEIPAYEPSGTG